MSRRDIEDLNARFVEAVEKGDAAAIASLYAPDARAMPPGAPTVTGQGIQDLWQGFLDMGVNGAALTTVSLEELGDVAIEVGQYEMRVNANVADVGKYVVVHRRQPDGSWKFGIDMWSSDRPASAT
jgi:ketosteroid isomerase-like protein